MVDNKITTGTTATTFSPNDFVTRGQLAAFFYRYSGQPPVEVDQAHPSSPPCASQVAGPTGVTSSTTTSAPASSTTTTPTTTTSTTIIMHLSGES